MNDDARQRLRDAFTRHGGALYEDPTAGAELVRHELGADLKREGFWLASAIEAGVPVALLSSPRGEPVESVVTRLSASLSGELGLAPEPAQWAVQSWAEALGLLAPGSFAPPSSDASDQSYKSDTSHDRVAATAPEVTQAFSPEELASRTLAEKRPLKDSEPEPPTIRPDPTRQISPADSDRAEAWLREANVLNKQGRLSESVTRCKQSLHVNPNDPFAWQLLGDLMAAQGELDQAEEAYRCGISLDPSRSVLEEKLGRILVIKEEEERERIKEEILGGANTKSAFNIKSHRNTIMMMITLVMLAVGLVLMLLFVESMDKKTGTPTSTTRPGSR